MGACVLTLARSVAKPTDGGQLSEDSASRAQDADLQQANVLEMTRRVSR
ncbi:MAG: hypothetical protein OEU36_23155 [Gammaproteobacteria bacterium]|nr:hypothetical protein [Gammaproteobacteria bacterium]